LLQISARHIDDRDALWLMGRVISSFHSTREGVGLPLGNLTSQLFVNIYMNGFDQFVKHKLKVKYYVRYADDFVILSEDRESLNNVLIVMGDFLKRRLRLNLHPDKVFIKTLASGVDFLGWVNFFDHRVLRAGTKRRMVRRIDEKASRETINSYLGMMKYGNGYKSTKKIFCN